MIRDVSLPFVPLYTLENRAVNVDPRDQVMRTANEVLYKVINAHTGTLIGYTWRERLDDKLTNVYPTRSRTGAILGVCNASEFYSTKSPESSIIHGFTAVDPNTEPIPIVLKPGYSLQEQTGRSRLYMVIRKQDNEILGYTKRGAIPPTAPTKVYKKPDMEMRSRILLGICNTEYFMPSNTRSRIPITLVPAEEDVVSTPIAEGTEDTDTTPPENGSFLAKYGIFIAMGLAVLLVLFFTKKK